MGPLIPVASRSCRLRLGDDVLMLSFLLPRKKSLMTTLKIEGMTCDHCRRAVEKALTDVPGVEWAEVFLSGGKAVVRGPVEVAHLLEAVQQAGYLATPLDDPTS